MTGVSKSNPPKPRKRVDAVSTDAPTASLVHAKDGTMLVWVRLQITVSDIIAAAVLSGNRNFEGRVHPLTRANYLASPSLVVAYALAGTERDAKDVEIPNIRWDAFVLMMRYIYTGSVTVEIDLAQELLRAADQYLLDDLKRLCEYTIAQDISEENVMLMYELAEAFNATTPREACLLFMRSCLIHRIIPDLQDFFISSLVKFHDPMKEHM
ncbi:hypothetical protein F3Y22_tig00110384pilonHSYRG00064 [Hibiscus syriacus]|uniref:BTB domain-containing protein n=1 Tax=Hibiscus syriacus TaxID=106335 RepID=A0A6A3AWH8_HIBSY|nr:hypothetical protein F3Y22_tig00110384pilonHSYRG00064 [Hibiscus syriacus]